MPFWSFSDGVVRRGEQQWYGDSVVSAEYSNGSFVCVTPTAVQSGAARSVHIEFEPELSSGATITGDAAVRWCWAAQRWR